MLAMMLVMQLGLSDHNRQLALGSMKKNTCQGVIDSVQHVFNGKDAPVETDKRDKIDGGERSFHATDDCPRVLVEWHPDGSITEHEADGNKHWFGPELAAEQLALWGFAKGKGKGKGAYKESRHPKEGDESEGEKNQGGLKCYDCNSPYHLSSSHHCNKRGVSMFSRHDTAEFAGFAAVEPDTVKKF